MTDSENPGEWTPAKRIRMKSRPMSQPKRPREMTTILEDMERDDLQRMGTGSVASKRQGEQPEELTAKERKVENSPMDDQEPEHASQTKARMDEMLMDQVMAVSLWNFTRLCERRKVRISNNQRIACRLGQERSSERNERP